MTIDPKTIAAFAAVAIAGYLALRRAPEAWRWAQSLMRRGSTAMPHDTDCYHRCCAAVELAREMGEPELANQIVAKMFPKLAPRQAPADEGADAE